MSSTQRRQVREEVADPLAALAVLLELPLRPDDPPLVLLAAPAERLDGDRLAVELVQLRLVVERVDLARPAVHEQEDDALGLRRRSAAASGRAGWPTGVGAVGARRRRVAEEAVAGEQAGQASAGEPGRRPPRGTRGGSGRRSCRRAGSGSWSVHRRGRPPSGSAGRFNRGRRIRSGSAPPGRTPRAPRRRRRRRWPSSAVDQVDARGGPRRRSGSRPVARRRASATCAAGSSPASRRRRAARTAACSLRNGR